MATRGGGVKVLPCVARVNRHSVPRINRWHGSRNSGRQPCHASDVEKIFRIRSLPNPLTVGPDRTVPDYQKFPRRNAAEVATSVVRFSKTVARSTDRAPPTWDQPGDRQDSARNKFLLLACGERSAQCRLVLVTGDLRACPEITACDMSLNGIALGLQAGEGREVEMLIHFELVQSPVERQRL